MREEREERKGIERMIDIEKRDEIQRRYRWREGKKRKKRMMEREVRKSRFRVFGVMFIRLCGGI